MRIRSVAFLCVVLASVGLPVASAGTRDDPEVTSPQGSPRSGLYVGSGVQDRLEPADPSTVDVRSAWFEAFHDAEGHLDGFQVTLRVWGTVEEAAEGTEYAVSWSAPLGCDGQGIRGIVNYTVGSEPVGIHDCGHVIHATAGLDGVGVRSGCTCTPLRLSGFEAAGDEIRWTVSLEDLLDGDGAGAYYSGTLLGAIRVQTAAYGDGLFWVGDDVWATRGFLFGETQDTTPPEYGFTTEDGAVLVREVPLEGWVTDDLAGVSRVQVELVMDPYAVVMSRTSTSLDCPEERRACDWSANLRFQAPGRYEVRVEATDLVGNVTAEGPTLRITVV